MCKKLTIINLLRANAFYTSKIRRVKVMLKESIHLIKYSRFSTNKNYQMIIVRSKFVGDDFMTMNDLNITCFYH